MTASTSDDLLTSGALPDALRAVLATRMRRNPRYSLRAFARDLQVAPSTLSEVLAGKQTLSLAKGAALVQALHLSSDEREHFLDLVAANQRADTTLKRSALARLRERVMGSLFHEIEGARFRSIARWHHLVILEFLKLTEVRLDAAAIAARLRLPRFVIVRALARLEAMGLVHPGEDGVHRPTHAAVSTGDFAESAFVRRFHADMIKLAGSALDEQSLTERDFQSLVIAIDERDVPALQRRIREFQRSIAREFSAAPVRDTVYACCVQLFRIGRGTE
jgi:uncharacterized protein (TIGR02147 family)